MVMPVIEALIPIAVAEAEKVIEDKRDEKRTQLDAEIADAESSGEGASTSVPAPEPKK